MDIFTAVIKTGDLKLLIKSGEPTMGELAEAWAKIVNEFYDITENVTAKYEWTLRAQYNLDVMKFNIATDILKIAEVYRSEKLIESLQNLGFDYSFDPEDYFGDVQSCKNEMASIRLKIRIQEQEIKELDKKQATSDLDDYYFERIYVKLSKYMGRNINDAKLTVAAYGFMLNEYVNSIKVENARH